MNKREMVAMDKRVEIQAQRVGGGYAKHAAGALAAIDALVLVLGRHVERLEREADAVGDAASAPTAADWRAAQTDDAGRAAVDAAATGRA